MLNGVHDPELAKDFREPLDPLQIGPIFQIPKSSPVISISALGDIRVTRMDADTTDWECDAGNCSLMLGYTDYRATPTDIQPIIADTRKRVRSNTKYEIISDTDISKDDRSGFEIRKRDRTTAPPTISIFQALRIGDGLFLLSISGEDDPRVLRRMESVVSSLRVAK